MRKSGMVALIVAGSLVVIGVALLSVGLILRGEFVNSNMTTNTYEIVEDFRDVSIVGSTAKIRIAVADDGVCRVESYENPGKEQYLPSVKDGVLTVERVDYRRWYMHMFDFGKTPSLTVYLPAEQWGSLSVRVSTGDVQIASGLFFEEIAVKGSTADVTCQASAAETLKIDLSTGDIEMQGNSAKNAELTVTTGQIEVEGFACTDLYVKVSTGDTELTDVVCKTFTSTGSTGDLELEGVMAEDYSIERSTGDVTFERCDAKKLWIKTDTGSVSGTLLSDMIFYAKSDTGKIRVPKSTTGGSCEITTDTGDVRISVRQ